MSKHIDRIDASSWFAFLIFAVIHPFVAGVVAEASASAASGRAEMKLTLNVIMAIFAIFALPKAYKRLRAAWQKPKTLEQELEDAARYLEELRTRARDS